MDPDTNLLELRDLVRCVQDAQASLTLPPVDAYRMATGRDLADDAERMAELVAALDGWLSGGGFLPAAWGQAAAGQPERNGSEWRRVRGR